MKEDLEVRKPAAVVPPAVDPARPGARLRLHYLDGLRGLAALHVVLLHSFVEIADVKGWLPDVWVERTRWVWNGRISVQIFIALSGYCLMMPVARAGLLHGGTIEFIKRRMRRILPPYYAALAFSLGVLAFVPGMGTPQGLHWDSVLPITRGVVLSHLLLLQDWSSDWILKLQAPMWTLAQEWQIYFVFALVLVPLWRRAGILATVTFTFVMSIVLKQTFFGHNFTFAAPQFLFLFGVGMFAATVSFPGSSRWLASLRDRMPWVWPATALWLVYLVLWLREPTFHHFASLPSATLVAGAIFCTLIHCTRGAQQRQAPHRLLRFFEWEPLVVLGTFSYSLYLVHHPVLGMFTLALHRWQIPGGPAVALELFVAVPLAAALAYGFHLLFERPFMRGHPKTLPRAEKAAVLDAAP